MFRNEVGCKNSKNYLSENISIFKVKGIKHHNIFFILSFCAVLFISCGGSAIDDDTITPQEPVEITPTNLSFNIEVVNSDATNLNGDGNGLVKFTATATDAVRYKFITGTGTEIENTTGTAEYTYTQIGAFNYTVTVYAYSTTNHSISTFKGVTVYVKEPELQLVWSDEFDVDGAPDNSKWGYNIGNGNNGWGNGESQYYTDRTDNVEVKDGILRITAKREKFTDPNNGNEYDFTSARMLTQDKYEFTYGRVEVRAKLPEGHGTWPAIWLLGANIDTVGWPTCGEIDIMEHWGHDPAIVSSATHNNACSGGCTNVTVGKTTLSDYSSEFHVYTVVWTEKELRFLIDGEFKYRYKPSTKNNDNWPYTADQFIILNVAMGGSWFDIDPDFTEATMEIDYVRAYQ